MAIGWMGSSFGFLAGILFGEERCGYKKHVLFLFILIGGNLETFFVGTKRTWQYAL